MFAINDKLQVLSTTALDDAVDEKNLNTNYFPFLQLPKEIRGLIYQSIPQREVVQCRLVSKQICSEIDQLYNFDGVINDFVCSPIQSLDRVFDIRLKSCKIAKRRQGDMSKPQVFRYPQLLKQVEIWHHCSMRTSCTLLTQCDSYLDKLIFDYRDSPLSDELPSIPHFNFENLTRLTLYIHLRGDFMESLLQDELLQQLIANSTLKRLREAQTRFTMLYINHDGIRLSKFLCELFGLFARNHRTLEKICITVWPKQNSTGLVESDAAGINYNLLSKLDQLKHFSLTYFGAPGIEDKYIHFSSNLQRIYSDIIGQQRRLNTLRVHVLFPLPVFNLASLVSKSCVSLELIYVANLIPSRSCIACDGTLLFDLAVFEMCTNLKKLVLVCECERGFPNEVVQLINFPLLPASITWLDLQKFKIMPQDFLSFFSKDRSNLKYARISDYKFRELSEIYL